MKHPQRNIVFVFYLITKADGPRENKPPKGFLCNTQLSSVFSYFYFVLKQKNKDSSGRLSNDAGVHLLLGGVRHQLDLLLLGQHGEALGSQRDGDLQTVADDRGGDQLVLGHLRRQRVERRLVEHHGVLERLARAPLGPLLGGCGTLLEFSTCPSWGRPSWRLLRRCISLVKV